MTDPTPSPTPAAAPADEPSILESAKAPETPGSSEPIAKPADGSQKPPADVPKGDEPKPDATIQKPQGAPEKYEPFKVPEGVTLDPKTVEGFQVKAKELNLSQEQAQGLVEFQLAAIKTAQEQLDQNFKTQQKQWVDDTRKALGADADKQLAYAATYRDKFLSPESRNILNDTGLSNHPALVQDWIRAGKAISEDTFVPGKPVPAKKTDGQLFYPGMKT